MSLNRTRIQPYIYQIKVEDMTPDDVKWLDKSIAGSYRGLLSRDEVLIQVAKGLVQLWRVGKWEGILLTEIIEWNNGRFLTWHSGAGKGLLKKLDIIIKFLSDYSKANLCSHWEVNTASKGLQRRFEKILKENFRTYYMET